MLLTLVSVPLAVLAVQLYDELRETSEERSTVRDIVPLTERRLQTIDLRSALSDERTWSIAALGVERFGVDPVVVEAVIGVDIEERYEQAKLTTDRFIEGFAPLRDQLERLRETRISNLQLAGGYESISDQVDELGREAARQLEERVRARPDADDLLRELALTEAAADVQLAVNEQFISSIASRFVESTGDPARELRTLVESRRTYVNANDRIDDLARGDGIRQLVQDIRSSDAERVLLNEVDRQIDTALRSGLNPAAGDLFTVAIEDLESLKGFLAAAEESTDAWVELTRVAGQELAGTAAGLARESSEKIDRTRVLLAVIGTVTVLATLFAAAVLSRSVRRLARSAQALRDGVRETYSPSGPREVELAGAAISEASTNFELLRRQAQALAAGELAHPDLERVAPGRLGATFKELVDTLTASIHDRQRAQEDAAWQARHDGLTGLPNRSAAVRDLQELLDGGAADVAVMVVDLDGFKDINDGHGHPAGDEVLARVADRLESCRARDHETYRLGGDEFVVVVPGVGSAVEARRVAHLLLDSIAAPIVLSTGTRVTVNCSIGVAMRRPEATVSDLLKSADVAVYEAKRAGRNRVIVCTPALLEESHRTTQISTELVTAIREGQLRLEYQPIVDAGGAVTALETLIRWDHPDRGLVGPATFIPVAERSDLIVDIDRWVLGQVAAQLAQWAGHGGLLGGMPVAVNLSTRHLNAESLFDDVMGPLREANVDPSRLSIEVTETALLEGADDARRNLHRLRAEGISIAVDDFGTGYSAITQLRIFPVDVIKIDRSFTAQVTDTTSSDRTLMQLIVEVAHVLGAEVITEGVESAEQAEVLVEMGSDALQGWYFSPSVRPEELVDLLRNLPWETSEVIRG